MRKAKYFLEKIETKEDLIKMMEKIPDRKWTKDKFTTASHSAYCFLGHIGLTPNNYGEEEQVIRKFKKLLGFSSSYSRGTVVSKVGKINDGKNPKYQQKTIKQRVLAFLRSTK